MCAAITIDTRFKWQLACQFSSANHSSDHIHHVSKKAYGFTCKFKHNYTIFGTIILNTF